MATDPGPHHIDRTRAILRPDLRVAPKRVAETFFEELDAEFGGFAGHVLVMRHDFDRDWPTWEIHPHGDELVYLLSGDVDLVLATADGERVLRVDEPGAYVIVPENTWHTARPRRRTSMLFVTPGEGTRNEASPR